MRYVTLILKVMKKFIIIASQFNEEITNGLLKGALKAFHELGIKQQAITVVHVPGAWEIPFIAHKAGKTKKYSVIIALGAVIKGDTSHDTWINMAVFPALQEIVEEYGVPVALGIITCNTWAQAKKRSANNNDNRGYVAAMSAFQMTSLHF